MLEAKLWFHLTVLQSHPYVEVPMQAITMTLLALEELVLSSMPVLEVMVSILMQRQLVLKALVHRHLPSS